MPLVFSGGQAEFITHIALDAEDAKTREQVTVLVSREVKRAFNLDAVRETASVIYDEGPRTPFLITATDMTMAGR